MVQAFVGFSGSGAALSQQHRCISRLNIRIHSCPFAVAELHFIRVNLRSSAVEVFGLVPSQFF